MREILFRGKTENGEWWYGDLFHTRKRVFIRKPILPAGTYYEHDEVIPDTVGQYTGLTDKNGKRIFEGDICSDGFRILVIRCDFYQWNCKVIASYGLTKGLDFPLWQWDNCPENGCRKLEVIGNIHDNPELLKEGRRQTT